LIYDGVITFTFTSEATCETVDRVIGLNTFSDLGRLCARFF